LKKRKKTANPQPKTERVTVYLDIDHQTKRLTVKHPAFGIDGPITSEPDLRYLLGEMSFHLGEYIWDRMNPWNGEDDD